MKLIAGSYRQDQFADAKVFALSLQALFEQYPAMVLEATCDVRSSYSIQRRFKFPPSIAEISEVLEEIADRQLAQAKAAREQRQSSKANRPYRLPANHHGCRCNVFVHAEAPQYQTFVDWSQSKEADPRDWTLDERRRPGIWIALSIWHSMGNLRPKSKAWQTPSEGELRDSLMRLAGQVRAEPIDAEESY